MTGPTLERWLVVACVSALGALGLMTWQLVDPTVWPVVVAMSIGQVFGTASFAAFMYVVFADFRAHRAGAVESPAEARTVATAGGPAIAAKCESQMAKDPGP